MSQKSRSQFKVIFSQGNIPNQQDFHDFIDSYWNFTDDGYFTGITGPAGPTGATGYGAQGSTGPTGATGTGIGNVVYRFGGGPVSPTNTNTYYIGGITDLAMGSTNTISSQIQTQITGQVTEVSILRYPSGAIGTSESSTFNIVNVTQATSSVISNAVSTNSGNGLWNNYTLASPLSVSSGDLLQITWNTPVWVTPPTSVRVIAHVKITY